MHRVLSIAPRTALFVVCSFLGACTVVADILATDVEQDAGEGSDATGPSASDAAPGACFKRLPGCPEGWQTIDNSCSCYLGDLRATPAEAHRLCRDQFAGHLLVIETATEQDAILSQLDGGGADFFLGLFHDNQQWRWVTGETLAQTGFSALLDASELRPDRACAQLDQDQGGAWLPKSCNENDVVCELDGKQAVSAPPAL